MESLSPDRIASIVLAILALGSGGATVYTTQTAPDISVWQVELQRQAERWHQELQRTRTHEAERCDALIARACE